MEQETILFQQKIKKPLHLPALTKNIHQLMDSLNDENVSCVQLAQIISCYPEISIRLISLVNSVWSAPVKPIINIEITCVRLGLSIIKSVSIAIAVASFFDSRRCPSFDSETFWTKSMLVAEGTHLLALQLSPEYADNELKQAAQTAGLLHYLGLLWLADNFPKETDQALKMQMSAPSLTINQALQQSADVNYCQINAWIAEQWELPKMLAVVMEHHLDADYQGEFQEITWLVNAAIEMTSAILDNLEAFPEHPALTQLGIQSAQQSKIFQQLLSKHEKTREMAGSLFG